ncbi:MAG: pantetheine-phosphate adenylyltransferase [Metamycoplasmataceae bacterium]
MRIAIYPGSFNPFHKGHFSIIKKALKIFDLIYVVVTLNPDKEIANDLLLNARTIKKHFRNNNKIIVLTNDNKLTATLASELGAEFIIRSSRDNLDFKYELELANANNSINNNLETIIFFPEYNHKDISSTILRHKKKMKID